MSMPRFLSRRGGREDERRNHRRLLDAALQVFDACGLDAPLSAVAERSGVSIASLYRHFPTRDDLIVELYDRRARALEVATITLLEEAGSDAGGRLDAYFAGVIQRLTTHSCTPALAARGLELYPTRQTDPRLLALLRALADDGRAAGLLADDVTAHDLVMVAVTIASLAVVDRGGADGIWQRQLAIARRGLSPRTAWIPLPAPASRG